MSWFAPLLVFSRHVFVLVRGMTSSRPPSSRFLLIFPSFRCTSHIHVFACDCSAAAVALCHSTVRQADNPAGPPDSPTLRPASGSLGPHLAPAAGAGAPPNPRTQHQPAPDLAAENRILSSPALSSRLTAFVCDVAQQRPTAALAAAAAAAAAAASPENSEYAVTQVVRELRGSVGQSRSRVDGRPGPMCTQRTSQVPRPQAGSQSGHWNVPHGCFDVEASGESGLEVRNALARCTDVQAPRRLFHAALCVFTLSAVPVSHLPSALANLFASLSPGGLLLIRDYGLYDMAMMRLAQSPANQVATLTGHCRHGKVLSDCCSGDRCVGGVDASRGASSLSGPPSSHMTDVDTKHESGMATGFSDPNSTAQGGYLSNHTQDGCEYCNGDDGEGPWMYRRGDGTLARFFSQEEIDRLVRDAGFEPADGGIIVGRNKPPVASGNGGNETGVAQAAAGIASGRAPSAGAGARAAAAAAHAHSAAGLAVANGRTSGSHCSRYCCVRSVNRRTGSAMHRVWVQGVWRKPGTLELHVA